MERTTEEGRSLWRIVRSADSSLRAACMQSCRRENCERSAAKIKMDAVVDRFGAICSAEYETDILLPLLISLGIDEEYNPAGAGSTQLTKYRVMMSLTSHVQ